MSKGASQTRGEVTRLAFLSYPGDTGGARDLAALFSFAAMLSAVWPSMVLGLLLRLTLVRADDDDDDNDEVCP